MRRAFCALASVLAITFSLPASAQDAPVTEFASELFFDNCMDYLRGELSLSASPLLKAKGFSEQAERRQHPSHGLIEVVTAKHGDNEFLFGGRPEKMCIVMVMGPDRLKVRDTIKGEMVDLSVEMSSAPVLQPGNGIVHEGFKGEVESNLFFNITLLTIPETVAKAPVAMTAFFTTE